VPEVCLTLGIDIVAPEEVLLIIHTVFTHRQDGAILNPHMKHRTETCGAKPRPALPICHA